MSHLAELPTEILEKILLHLPSQDVVKMEVVRCGIIRRDSALTFRHYAIDQSTFPGPDSQFSNASVQTRPPLRRFGRKPSEPL